MGQAVGDDLKINHKLTTKIDLFALYGVFIIFMINTLQNCKNRLWVKFLHFIDN